MKTILVPVLILLQTVSFGQYYYNDIIGTNEINRQMNTYMRNKVRSVSATGVDQRGTRATNFSEVQEVLNNGKMLKISTISNLNKTVVVNSYDDQGRIIRMADSSTAVQTILEYQYDDKGRVGSIRNTTRDSANDFNQVEIHQWFYGTDNKPTKMYRIINGTDSLEVRFVPDEFGNPGDEKTYRHNVETGAIYYYYDEKGRITDIVRYNNKAKKLLPDQLFEYDDQDRMIQKITTTTSVNLNYLIWRYIYDDKGLKTKEALFNSDKQLTGKIEFAYTFN
jgi:YD repeat-containing protein